MQHHGVVLVGEGVAAHEVPAGEVLEADEHIHPFSSQISAVPRLTSTADFSTSKIFSFTTQMSFSSFLNSNRRRFTT